MLATRFAPSPTGLLHLGHGYSALVAHDLARRLGGRFLLRIDDIDGGRSRPEYRAAIDDDLRWLGLNPDAPPVIQSERIAHYARALGRLADDGLAYPCFCTRAQIVAEVAASAAAPHHTDAALYPGTCRRLDAATRKRWLVEQRPHAWRLDMAKAVKQAPGLEWSDGDGIAHIADPAAHGDVVLARRDAASAYHLASSLDDAAMGISHVVRGADLIAATAIHRLLQALLGLPTPIYVHHRLIANGAGQRLAKRDDAASLAAMRDAGVDPAKLVAALRDGRLPLGYNWIRD